MPSTHTERAIPWQDEVHGISIYIYLSIHLYLLNNHWKASLSLVLVLKMPLQQKRITSVGYDKVALEFLGL